MVVIAGTIIGNVTSSGNNKTNTTKGGSCPVPPVAPPIGCTFDAKTSNNSVLGSNKFNPNQKIIICPFPQVFPPKISYTPPNQQTGTGGSKVYVIYYNNPGSGFKEQALNSLHYNNKNVSMHSVISVADFKKAWNAMSGTIDSLYLYLHGGTGVLYFKGESLGIAGIKSLSAKKVKKIHLYSCHGGDGKEGNNVAWAFAKLTGATVRACTGSVSYTKVLGKYLPRTAFDGFFKTFYYEKEYILWGNIVAKSR